MNIQKILYVKAIIVVIALFSAITLEFGKPDNTPVLPQTAQKTVETRNEPITLVSKETASVPAVTVNISEASAATDVHETEIRMSDKLMIPTIGVDAPLKGMGLTADGKMAVPDNFTEVGWYNLGTKPGNKGSAVLGAHVDDGYKTPGVFKNLKNLKTGDDIFVFDEAGKKLHFKIAYIKVFDRNEKTTTEVFAQNDKARLNLITCYGEWLPSENTYAERLVVFAELVS